MRGRLASRWSALTRLEQWAWGLALALFVAGDMATTAVGLHVGAVEANRTGAELIQAIGLWPAMIAGKIIAVVLLYAAWVMWSRWLDSDRWPREGMPITVAAVGAVVTANNIYVILVSVGRL